MFFRFWFRFWPKMKSILSVIHWFQVMVTYSCSSNITLSLHCKYLNARFECNDIVITVITLSIQMQNYLTLNVLPLVSDGFSIWIERVMTEYENHDVIAFKSCIQKFTVHLHTLFLLCRVSYIFITAI